MKNLLVILALMLCSVAFADSNSNITGTKVYGVLCVNSSTAETIVAIPWVDASAGSDSGIKVADIVKTTNLTENDRLFAYTDGNYEAWKLVANSSGVLEWQAIAAVSGDSVSPILAPAANTESLTRGRALLLIRQKYSSPFYLFGQVPTTSTADVAIAGGSSEADAYTMIAPPVDATVSDLNNYIEYSGGTPSSDDYIIVSAGDGGLMKHYSYDAASGKWGTYQTGDNVWTPPTFTAGLSIPVGQGAWYVSKSSGFTLRWKNLPSK